MLRPLAWLGVAWSAGIGFTSVAEAQAPAGPRPIFPSRPKPDAKPEVPTVIQGGLSAEAMTQALRAERDAYTRRLDVCTQLRKIAADTKNDKLANRALELEQQAEEAYRERIARLGVKAELRAPSPSSSEGTESLERTLGSGIAVAPTTTPTPTPTASPASAAARPRQFREVPQ